MRWIIPILVISVVLLSGCVGQTPVLPQLKISSMEFQEIYAGRYIECYRGNAWAIVVNITNEGVQDVLLNRTIFIEQKYGNATWELYSLCGSDKAYTWVHTLGNVALNPDESVEVALLLPAEPGGTKEQYCNKSFPIVLTLSTSVLDSKTLYVSC